MWKISFKNNKNEKETILNKIFAPSYDDIW